MVLAPALSRDQALSPLHRIITITDTIIRLDPAPAPARVRVLVLVPNQSKQIIRV